MIRRPLSITTLFFAGTLLCSLSLQGTEQNNPLDQLPDEMTEKILFMTADSLIKEQPYEGLKYYSAPDPKKLLNLQLVCKKWRAIILDYMYRYVRHNPTDQKETKYRIFWKPFDRDEQTVTRIKRFSGPRLRLSPLPDHGIAYDTLQEISFEQTDPICTSVRALSSDFILSETTLAGWNLHHFLALEDLTLSVSDLTDAAATALCLPTLKKLTINLQKSDRLKTITNIIEERLPKADVCITLRGDFTLHPQEHGARSFGTFVFF